MRRNILFFLTLALMLFLATAGLAEQTDIMERIFAANDAGDLVALHGSLQVTFTKDAPAFFDAENSIDYSIYMDGELLYVEDEYSQHIEYGDGAFYDIYNGYIGKYLYLDSVRMPYVQSEMLLSASSVNERVVQVENKDGKTIVTTEMTGDELRQLNPDRVFNDNIAKCVCVYTVDAETLEMDSLVSSLTLTDGTVAGTHFVVTHPTLRPEKAQMLWEHANSKDVRICTFVIEPGTPEEKTVVMEVQKGDYVFPTSDVSFGMYDDAECTVVHQTSNPNDDMTVYIKFDR